LPRLLERYYVSGALRQGEAGFSRKILKKIFMLIINVKEGESIDRALKRYKRKFQKTGVLKELRERKHFTKPSIKRRSEVLKAAYKQKKFGEQ
jgi:small subunit ribosomal protein S21